MMLDLHGKVALVTGAAGGLGRAFAESLLTRGANVVISDMNDKTGLETEVEFQNNFGSERIKFIKCDVTKKEEMQDLFTQAKSKYGRLDVVVNNAGIMQENEWELVIQINLVAVIRGSRLATQHMGKSGGGEGGVVVNISSLAGLWSMPHFPTYTATKHGVLGWTKSYGTEAAEEGIRVVALCPSFADTNLTTDIYGSHTEERVDSLKKVLNQQGVMKVSLVVDAFLRLLDDTHNNGGALTVTSAGMEYVFPNAIKGKVSS